MENKCYRSTINAIPRDQSKLKSSSIPFFFNITFQKENTFAPVVTESLVRCGKCKAYLNPYVEIIMPGYKWKCNLCETINETSIPFQMKERRSCENSSDPIVNSQFNKAYFVREELRNDVYELEAPDSFNVATPDPPVICFVVDVSLESTRLAILPSVLHCIREVLRNINYDKRTKVSFIFFNEAAYVLNNNGMVSVINGEVPLILCDKIFFSIDPEGSNSVHSIEYEKVEKYFEDKKSPHSNYLLAVKIAIQAFRSASLFSFISTAPNYLESKIEPSPSLVCKNNEYKTVSESLVRKNICSNLFIMARTSVEFSSLKMLSQYTGGQVFHYPNYDGTDAVSTSRLFCDFSEYFGQEVGFGAICRVRANDGIVLKSVYGSFFQKAADLLAYSSFNPAHTLNFSIQMYNDVKNALFLQVAMVRVTKSGMKLIRVVNICIPVVHMPFYESCDAHAIAHCLALESFYYESKKKQAGKEHLESRITAIWKEIKSEHGRIPDCLHNLPSCIVSLMKGIPLRPDLSTPADFRGFYMYMLSNTSPKIVDLIIYPLLLNLASESVVPLPLSLCSIDQKSILVLDTGVNLFFYVGKDCDPELVFTLFENAKSGPFVFSPPDNEFSRYVSELVVFLLDDRVVKPRFILANGKETNVHNDIFFSYMYDDRMYQVPSVNEFRNMLDAKQ